MKRAINYLLKFSKVYNYSLNENLNFGIINRAIKFWAKIVQALQLQFYLLAAFLFGYVLFTDSESE